MKIPHPRTRRHPLWLAIAAALAIDTAHAQLPTGAQVIHGSASIATAGNAMTVTNSPNAILNWQSFSIGANHAVNFAQQNAASAVLNRVTGADPSAILGSLTSNGKVFLINPNGILFGRGARIDVAGLVASTLNISNDDFLNNRLNFLPSPVPGEGAGERGKILNQGNITTPMGGQVYLIGSEVSNEGIITSPQGEVVLAAGNSATLLDTGTPNVTVNLAATDQQALNIGQIVAQGGSANIYGALVRNSGIVNASSAVSEGGRIVLRATKNLAVAAGAKVSAGGTEGGRIELAGANVTIEGDVAAPGHAQGGTVELASTGVTYLDGRVDVSASEGRGGRIALTTGKLEGMAGGELRADGAGLQGAGGVLRVEAAGMAGLSSTLSARGADTGGRIELTGDAVILMSAKLDATGGRQGGTVHLGGGWQGGGDLPQARETFVGLGSTVDASGTGSGGRGGEVVHWSTGASELHGTLQATGPAQGGRIEFSSKGRITQGSTGTLKVGAGGTVLFDPKNLIITDAPPDNISLARKVTSGSTGGTMPALADGDALGGALALDGDRLAVSAGGDDTGGNSRGAVHLFTGVGTDFSGLVWRKKLANSQGAVSMPALADVDGFGSALAMDGDHLVVGAFGDNTGAADAGAVHMFSGVGTNFSGLTWRGKLASGLGATSMPTLAGGDYFGYALGLDGDRLAVGSVLDATGGFQRGAVHLFTGVGSDFSGLTWRKKLATGQGAVNMPALANQDQFGVSLALDGDRLAIAAYVDDTGGTDRGAVHLFTGVGSDFSGLTWNKKLSSGAGATVMPVLNDSDQFGISVALSGNRLAVGALGDDTGGPERGAVYLFDGVGADFSGLTWQRKLASGQGAGSMVAVGDNDRFGRSVAMDGDHIVVGADQDDTGGTDRGAVHLFTGASTTNFSGLTWQKKVASGTGAGMSYTSGDSFGHSVALDADRLAVGALNDDTGGTDRGAIHLFTGVGTDFSGLTWQKKLASGIGAINMPALTDGDYLGWSLALNGDRMAVGAPGDDAGGTQRGAVHLFSGVGSNFSGLTWQKKLASGQGASGMPPVVDVDWFGGAVALDGGQLAVGALGDDTGGANRGAVHLFNGVGSDFSGLTWQKKLASGQGAAGMPALADGDGFGSAVALDENRLAVGASYDATGGPNRGAAHLFSEVGTDYSGLTWQKKLATGQGAAGMPALTNGEYFGGAVALDGDRLAVGSWGYNAGSRQGAAYLFNGVGTDFSGLTYQTRIESGAGATGMSALAGNDNFGVSLSLDGDRLAVGANHGTGDAPGAVYLFSLKAPQSTALTEWVSDGNGSWTITNGRLIGNYNIFCGSAACPQANLILADAYQPSGDWKASVDFRAIVNPDDPAYTQNHGSFALWQNSNSRINSELGIDQATGTVWYIAAYWNGSAWTTIKQLPKLTVNPNIPHTAMLEKVGTTYKMYLDGTYIDEFTDTYLNGTGKLGFHTYASIDLDNFKVYSTGTTFPPVYTQTFDTGVNFANGGTGYKDNPAATSYLTPSSITALLNAGTAVTLQASNDITVASAIVANNPSGNGGQLNLQAGRSVLINANITTDNATLDVNANSSLAAGVVDAYRDAGAATVTMAAGTTINTGSGILSIGLGNGAGKTNSTGGDISLVNLAGGTLVLKNDLGQITASGTVIANSLDLTATAGGATFANSGNNVGTLSANVGWLNFRNAGALTIGSGTYATGVNATGQSTITTLSGDLTLTQSVATTDATVTALILNAGGDAAAGTATGGNIVLSGSPTISVGAGGTARLYTGSVAGSTGLAALLGSGSGRFRYNSDEATSNYATALGTGLNAIYREQPVLTVSGGDLTVSYGTAPGALVPTVTGHVNGDTAAQAMSTAPTLTVGGGLSSSGHYTAGSHALTVAGAAGGLGYGFSHAPGTLTVSPLSLSLAGLTAANKVYDGTAMATFSGAATPAGVLAGDTVTVNVSGQFADRHVGTGKTVTLDGATLGGADGANYTLATPGATGLTADITVLPSVT